MELIDVIHFYFGCECKYKFIDWDSWNKQRIDHEILERLSGDFSFEVKPILRPLSDMTEEEMKECGNLVYDFSDEPDLNNWQWKDFQIITPEQFQWLISRSFDLFDLISSGQAIDKTKQ